MGPEHARALPSERIEARLAYAKIALKVTDAQLKQWNAVADFLRKKAKERDAKIQSMMQSRHPDAPRPDAMEMLQHRQQMMTEAAASEAEFIAVAKPFYASLNDEQKKIAGEFLQPHRGFGGRGFHRPGPGAPPQ